MNTDLDTQIRGYAEYFDTTLDPVELEELVSRHVALEPLTFRRPRGWVVVLASAVAVLLLIGVVWLGRSLDDAPFITEPTAPTTTGPSTTVPDLPGLLPSFNLADLPAFRITVFYDRNPDGLPDLGLPPGATAVVELSFEAPDRVKRQINEMNGPRIEESPEPGAGSYLIAADGKFVEYNADTDDARELTGGYDVLGELFFGNRWQARCVLGEVEVLPDETLFARDAHHLRCSNLAGDWEFWIDEETGLVLKMNGELPENSRFFGSSPQGGFEVTSIEYNPAFGPDLFDLPEVTVGDTAPGPEGSLHLTYATHHQDQNIDTVVQEVWYDPDRGTRTDVLEGSASGSFSVWTDGELQWSDASRDTYGSGATQNPGIGRPQDDPPAGCEQADEQLIGRRVKHLSCSYPPPRSDEEWWIDDETELVLRLNFDQQLVFEVTSLETEPAFPVDIFEFTPPDGSIPIAEYEANPWNYLNLTPGELAPTWQGPLVRGGEVALADLHGKPTLILFWQTWDLDFSLPAARDFEEIYDTWQNQVNLASVVLYDDQETIRSVLDQGRPDLPDGELRGPGRRLRTGHDRGVGCQLQPALGTPRHRR